MADITLVVIAVTVTAFVLFAIGYGIVTYLKEDS
jgi:hypothetical protein